MHLDDLSENAAQNRYGDGLDDFTPCPPNDERGKTLKEADYWEGWRIRSDSMFETLWAQVMLLLAQCCSLSHSSLRLMIFDWVGAFSSVLKENVSMILWPYIQPYCQSLPQYKKQNKIPRGFGSYLSVLSMSYLTWSNPGAGWLFITFI